MWDRCACKGLSSWFGAVGNCSNSHESRSVRACPWLAVTLPTCSTIVTSLIISIVSTCIHTFQSWLTLATRSDPSP